MPYYCVLQTARGDVKVGREALKEELEAVSKKKDAEVTFDDLKCCRNFSWLLEEREVTEHNKFQELALKAHEAALAAGGSIPEVGHARGRGGARGKSTDDSRSTAKKRTTEVEAALAMFSSVPKKKQASAKAKAAA